MLKEETCDERVVMINYASQTLRGKCQSAHLRWQVDQVKCAKSQDFWSNEEVI